MLCLLVSPGVGQGWACLRVSTETAKPDTEWIVKLYRHFIAAPSSGEPSSASLALSLAFSASAIIMSASAHAGIDNPTRGLQPSHMADGWKRFLQGGTQTGATKSGNQHILTLEKAVEHIVHCITLTLDKAVNPHS